jgi:CubicO group peptidase (beta-lactamase class C family)
MARLQRCVRRAASLFLLGVLPALVGCGTLDAARVATAMTAHVMCSQTFVVGREPTSVFKKFVTKAPGLDRVGPLLAYRVEPDAKRVSATLAGGFREEAGFADGRGCTVGAPQPALESAPTSSTVDPFNAPDDPVIGQDAAIVAALDRAFAEPAAGPAQNVVAIVVVHDGRIIAERYAPGFTPRTPIHGWSVSKSAVQALVGVLVRQGRMDVSRPGAVARWRGADDPRRSVTIDMLLRHVAGHPFGSESNGFDAASRMLFLAGDTYGVALAAAFDPDTAIWRYSDANYQILSGVLRDELNGAAGLQDFAQRELFAPLGMQDVTLEYDAAGSPMGAAFMFASARDWARLGWLFANDGTVGDRRILPKGWTDYSSKPTPAAAWGYGAGFWTNVGDSEGAMRRRSWGAPEGSYFANGNFGQSVVIAPRERLVVARFGYSLENGGQSLRSTMRLTGEVAAALRR